MRSIILASALALLLTAAGSALAGERTVTLRVDGMTCVACPYIVKKSLTRVDGVSKVAVSYADKKAVITFDDARVDVAALTEATADAGFPSQLIPRIGNDR